MIETFKIINGIYDEEVTNLHTSSIVIYRYSNFGNTYLSKEFARVLGPGQIVTSLGTVLRWFKLERCSSDDSVVWALHTCGYFDK
jgi:hypothetical protein